MSNIVDDRIVNMRFDNSDFEKNVSTSMNTLDKLKKSLDFSNSEKSLKGLQEATNRFSMDRIEESLTAIQNRFSTMGVVGMTVIQNLTNSALGMLGNISSRISSMIIQGGISRAMNIENAKFQLEGLGIEYKDVFDAIDYAVTNTAYGLDAAAEAAAQLSAAGLDYKNVIMTHEEDQKELTQMSMALRAVSGVAAQTQSDYSMVARYFQDIANAGKVTGATLTYMTQVLNLPVSQNLAEGLQGIADGSLEASESVKTAVKNITKGAKVSAADIQKWASKGLITFDMFSTVMFDKYADHAVAANRTLMGVMSNIRAAFSKIGAEFVSPLIEIDGIVVKMLDSIRAKVNQIKPMIIPFAKSLTDAIKVMARNVKEVVDNADLTWMKPFFTGLGKVIQGLVNYLNAMKSAFQSLFPRDTTNRLMSFSESLKTFGDVFYRQSQSLENLQKMYDKFRGLFSILSIGKTIFNTFLAPFKGFIEGLKESAGLSGNFVDSLSEWLQGIDKMLKESEKLKAFTENLFNAGKTIGSFLTTFISDIISAFKSLKEGPSEFISNIFDNLITNLGHTIIRIIEIISGKDLSKVIEVYDNILNVVKTLISGLAEFLSDGIDKIADFFTKLREILGGVKLDGSIFGDFSSELDTDLTPLQKIFKALSAGLGFLLDAMKSILPPLKVIGEGIVSVITNIFDGIKKAFNEKTFKDSLKNVTFATLLYNLKNVLIQLKKIFGIFNLKKNPFASLDGFLTQLKDTALSLEKNFNAKYFITIAGSVLMLAFAMNMIANIDKDKMAGALASVLLLIAAMTKIATALSGPQAAIMTKGLTGLIAMSLAIRILAGAAKAFGDMEWDQLGKAGAGIAGLMILLTAFSKIMSTSAKESKHLASGLTGLIALSLAIKILANVAKQFGSMEWPELGKAGAAIGSLMILLTMFSKIMQSTSKSGFLKSSKKETSGMIQLGIGLMFLAKSMQMLVPVAQAFGGMNWEQLGKAGAAITVMVGLLTTFSKVMESSRSGFSSKQISGMIQLGLGLIMLAKSMQMLVPVAQSFAGMDWGELGKAGAAIGSLLLGLSAFSKLTSGGNLLVLGTSLIVIAGSMKIFASAAKDLGKMDWGELGKAGAAITALLLGLGLFTSNVDAGKLAAISGSLIIFSAAILLLVPSVMAFSSLSLGAMVVSLLELAGVLFVLYKAAEFMAPMSKSLLALSGSLALFGIALASIGAGLMLLSAGVASASASIVLILDFIKQVIIGIVDTIHELIPLIVETVVDIIDQFLISLKDHIPSMVDSILDIVIQVLNILKTRLPELAEPIFGIVNGLADVFKTQLGNLDPQSFIDAIIGISVFLGLLAASAFIAQKALVGIGAIMLVMAEVTGMFLILSGLDVDKTLAIAQGLSETLLALSAATAILTLVGAGASAAAGGVLALGVVIAGIVAILAALGGLKQIPGFDWLMSEGMAVLNKIGLAIGEFVGNIIGGIGIGITDAMPQMADNLSEFAIRLMPFITTMKMIDNQVLESALSLAAMILALTAADVIESLTSWFTGGTSIAEFGKEIAELAPYLMEFANTVRGINAQDVEAAANAGKALAEMAKNLPNEGGLLAKVVGENDIEEFAKKLVPFGTAMMAYSKSVEGLDVGVVEKSAAAGKAVAELANSLPNTGGVAGWFMGENDMDEFGEQLVKFGKKLTAYSTYVKDLDASVVEKSATAATALSELANNLPNTGGVVSWFTGDNDMESFGEQLVVFGRALSRYSESIKDVDAGLVEKTITAAKALAELANAIPNSGGILSVFTGDNDFEAFGDGLTEFGESMKEFSDSLIGIDLTGLSGLTTGVREIVNLANEIAATDIESFTTFAKSAKSFASDFASFGELYIQQFTDQFKNSIETVNTTVQTFIGYFITGFQEQTNQFWNEGMQAVMYFDDGMLSMIESAKNAAKRVGEAALKGLSDLRPKFVDVGKNLIYGLLEGLSDAGAMAAINARIASIGKSIDSAMHEATQESSPSKMTREIGRFLTLGLALGMTDSMDDVDNASRKVATNAIDVMKSSIERIQDIVSDDMDLNPVITPVMDLSNVESNASRINDLFNNGVRTGNIKAAFMADRDSSDGLLQNPQLNGVNGNTIFNQYNYSPKALSRAEIYRQTRNQFALYREAMR